MPIPPRIPPPPDFPPPPAAAAVGFSAVVSESARATPGVVEAMSRKDALPGPLSALEPALPPPSVDAGRGLRFGNCRGPALRFPARSAAIRFLAFSIMSLSSLRETPPLAGAAGLLPDFSGMEVAGLVDPEVAGLVEPELACVAAACACCCRFCGVSPRSPRATPWAIAPVAAAAWAIGEMEPAEVCVAPTLGTDIGCDWAGCGADIG